MSIRFPDYNITLPGNNEDINAGSLSDSQISAIRRWYGMSAPWVAETFRGEDDEEKKKEEEKLRRQKELLDYNKYLELKERFEENGVIGFKPSDVVLYKPRNEIGIVENITGCGILVSEFNQLKSNLCKPEDLEKL